VGSASFPLAEMEECSVRRVVIGGVAVAVVRLEGDEVHALGDVCSHANVSLSGGDVWCEERELECPQHGSTFSLETGEALTLPATQPVPVYRAEVADGTVTVHVDEEAE
jgi:3-phenylpropionate/trans-cinnamate dioxygenase ferredoxin component